MLETNKDFAVMRSLNLDYKVSKLKFWWGKSLEEHATKIYLAGYILNQTIFLFERDSK